jgi:peptide methionine sulfoxide reductase msrA/msrB
LNKKIILTLIVTGVLIFTGFFNTGNTMEKKAVATLAGGCFWCMEPPFEKLDGVLSVVPGYTGGKTKNPSYEEVTSGHTGHYEAVRIEYDPNVISYEELLLTFWQNIDPVDDGGQFYDRGTQYYTAIFYHDTMQKKAAEKSKAELASSERFDKPIVTAILPAREFYEAEEYHHDYYKKNPLHYNRYKDASGRENYFKKFWDDKEAEKKSGKKMGKADLKSKLTPLQYHVTQENGTEPPFNNTYWDNKKQGIYVDIIDGTVLFTSLDKYDSGTGWPCFSQTVDHKTVKTNMDYTHNMTRIEVRSSESDAHLGHIFDDNKSPTGKRFCINSASLRFIPVDDLEDEGYAEYTKLFQ